MTHPNKDNQAERAAFEAAYAAQYPTTLNIAQYKLERDEQGDYEDGAVFVAWEMWQAARAAPPALDAEGLPALEDPTCFGMDHILGKAVYGYTAEQVRQAQRDAYEAGSGAGRAYQRKVDEKIIERLRARQDQQPARASIEGVEFFAQLEAVCNAWLELDSSVEGGEATFEAADKLKEAQAALIAHINAWGGVEPREGA